MFERYFEKQSWYCKTGWIGTVELNRSDGRNLKHIFDIDLLIGLNKDKHYHRLVHDIRNMLKIVVTRHGGLELSNFSNAHSKFK